MLWPGWWGGIPGVDSGAALGTEGQGKDGGVAPEEARLLME